MVRDEVRMDMSLISCLLENAFASIYKLLLREKIEQQEFVGKE